MRESTTIVLGLTVTCFALLGLGFASYVVAHATRALGRSIERGCVRLLVPLRMLGAWRKRRALAVARVRDHRDMGMLRSAMEANALLAHQVALLQERLDAREHDPADTIVMSAVRDVN